MTSQNLTLGIPHFMVFLPHDSTICSISCILWIKTLILLKLCLVLAPEFLSTLRNKTNIIVPFKSPKQLHALIFWRMHNQFYQISCSKLNITKHKQILYYRLQQLSSINLFTHLFVPFFNKYLLNVYSVPRITLNIREVKSNRRYGYIV